MPNARRPRSLLVVLGAVAALMLPGAVSADHSWGSYHWARTSNPFTVQLGDNVSTGWDSYLETTSLDWSVSNVIETPVVSGRTKPQVCRPTSGRVEVCSHRYGDTGWLGVAQIWISGSHITQGTAKLNDTYFNTATYNTSGWRNLVMCQEVGHTFGLGHVNENFDDWNTGSCMDYTRYPAGTINPDGTEGMPSNEHPNQHDYDQLATIYEHTDGANTTKQSKGSSGVDVATIHSDWGRLVASTNGGRTQTFVRDLGNGARVVTHVIWTLEHHDGHHE